MSYTVDEGTTRQRTGSTPGETDAASSSGFDAKLQAQLGHMVWEAGSRHIRDSLNSYGRIDYFRPYFDVEPRQVRNRLIQSFIPRKAAQISVSDDLYGPSMIVLTMVALLLFNMKSSGYTSQDGTLIGTAMVSCFGTWLALSVVIYTACFLLGADIPIVHVFSLFGYSMSSHCLVLLLTSLFHPSHDHFYFFVLLLLFCVPSALRMGIYVSSKTREHSHKLTLLCVVAGLHILYLVYLHFGFHVMVQEIDEILGETGGPIQSGVSIDFELKTKTIV